MQRRGITGQRRWRMRMEDSSLINSATLIEERSTMKVSEYSNHNAKYTYILIVAACIQVATTQRNHRMFFTRFKNTWERTDCPCPTTSFIPLELVSLFLFCYHNISTKFRWNHLFRRSIYLSLYVADQSCSRWFGVLIVRRLCAVQQVSWMFNSLNTPYVGVCSRGIDEFPDIRISHPTTPADRPGWSPASPGLATATISPQSSLAPRRGTSL